MPNTNDWMDPSAAKIAGRGIIAAALVLLAMVGHCAQCEERRSEDCQKCIENADPHRLDDCDPSERMTAEDCYITVSEQCNSVCTK